VTAAAAARTPVARVNGIALNAPGEDLAAEILRQRACSELLRQAAQAAGLLSAGDVASADGVLNETASTAIEALLERELNVPEPSEEACLRHYAAHKRAYRTGERVRARHILFAVTPGVDVAALRQRAESTLLAVRCRDGGAADAFAEAARQLSNCPSGGQSGDLGWLEKDDCAPELARELFGRVEIGVLPRLVTSRFGLHVVEVLERRPGTTQAFESVRGAVGNALRQRAFVTALRQYLQVLATEACVEGVELDPAATPLVQ
jgi:peptidyl-prolyl cis-trans isomerase C